ncbi:MAG: LON peptidase substrate-binding domain-containing protein, partial [Acidobacteriota bacterium]
MNDTPETLDLDAGIESIPIPEILPVVPIRGLVLFPYTIVPLAVGRRLSLTAVNEAYAGDGLLLLLTQKDGTLESPEPDDLFDVGCVGQVMRMVKLPDGNVSALVQGLGRVRVDYLSRTEPFLEARVSP